MNKREYLDCLERLLADLPQEERLEAIEYYSDYLEEAGPDGEQEAMRKLGSPEVVAAAVREGLGSNGNEGSWTETGYERWEARFDAPAKQTDSDRREHRKLRILWGLLAIALLLFLKLPFLSVLGTILIAALIVVAVLRRS